MSRLFIIYVCLSWIHISSAQSLYDNFKVSYPGLVHQGQSFEISIITSNETIDADILYLYIIPQNGIEPELVTLQTETGDREIDFVKASMEEFLYDAVMCSINLPESYIPGTGSFFQIIIKFKSKNIEYSEIDFYGEFRKGSRVIDYLRNTSEELLTDLPNYHRVKINFYSSAVNGEKSLLLEPKSEFTISPSFSIKNKLLVEFWMNLNQKGYPFLEIKNKQTGMVDYRLITNDFQILLPESDFNREIRVTPHFVPINVWIHLALVFSPDRNIAEFYCDGKQIAVFEINTSFSMKDILLSFVNKSEGSFRIDQLRVIDLNESIDVSVNNCNFTSFISKKSEVKLQFNFNENSISDLTKYNYVFQNKTVLEVSDAPIFSRAPELNLRIMNNYYELSWLGGDFANASRYILEQAEGERGYKQIYKIDTDNSEEKTYSFLSERINNSEIVYFRVKQVNKDGSVVYSSHVKVGQGELEEFIVGQNYPNPFNPTTQISIEVLVDSEFKIIVYNLEGKEISVLYEGFLTAGEYNFTFDGSDLPSGIYLYKVYSPNFSQTKKMILAK